MSDTVDDDVATLTALDGTTFQVLLPPYPNFPDNAPKIVRMGARLFQRTSTFGYGPQEPTAYQEFNAPEVKPA